MIKRAILNPDSQKTYKKGYYFKIPGIVWDFILESNMTPSETVIFLTAMREIFKWGKEEAHKRNPIINNLLVKKTKLDRALVTRARQRLVKRNMFYIDNKIIFINCDMYKWIEHI